MAYIIFNGKSSEEIGLKITELSLPARAEQKLSKESIPGRMTDIIFLQNQYENIKITVKFELKKGADIRIIYNWLRGRGKLIISDEPDKYYNAISASEIARKRINGIFSNITVKFECEPFACREVEPIDITTALSYTRIDNNGTVNCEPLITFQPVSGADSITITTNGEALSITIPAEADGYPITVDSELQLIYFTNSNGARINILPYSSGNLPIFHEADNYIKHSGNVQKMTIEMNERWY